MKLTQNMIDALQKAEALEHVFEGEGHFGIHAGTLRALERRGMIQWDGLLHRFGGRSHYVITQKGREVLEEYRTHASNS